MHIVRSSSDQKSLVWWMNGFRIRFNLNDELSSSHPFVCYLQLNEHFPASTLVTDAVELSEAAVANEALVLTVRQTPSF